MNERIKLIVQGLYRIHGTCNPLTIADILGIEIRYVPFRENPQGQYIKILDEPCILISDKLENTEGCYFILAHELYHYLQHEDLFGYYIMTGFTRGKLEQEANAFATILLLNYYIEEHDRYPSTFNDICYRFGIPLNFAEFYA